MFICIMLHLSNRDCTCKKCRSHVCVVMLHLSNKDCTCKKAETKLEESWFSDFSLYCKTFVLKWWVFRWMVTYYVPSCMIQLMSISTLLNVLAASSHQTTVKQKRCDFPHQLSLVVLWCQLYICCGLCIPCPSLCIWYISIISMTSLDVIYTLTHRHKIVAGKYGDLPDLVGLWIQLSDCIYHAE